MNILDVYTKKEYDCPKKCGAKVYYAKLADDTGKYVTTDGLLPNGKYGKESNVLSGAVDVNVKDALHRCTLGETTEKYWKLVRGTKPVEKQITTTSSVTPNVRWSEVPEKLTATQSKLYHGYHELTTVAYMLTKEQHPHEEEDSSIFGMIVHAKSLVLSNLLLTEAITKSKTV